MNTTPRTSAPKSLSMRERFARAIHQADMTHGAFMAPDWHNLDPVLQGLFLAEADACLDCLTVPPSEAMVLAGQMANIPRYPSDGEILMSRWEAMVRAMIQEGK